MGAKTGITWTDHTFNPWWGCTKISPGCTNCYAAAFDKRVGGDHWKPGGERRTFGAKHWNEPRKWNEAAKRDGVRRRVFCASMADVFEDREDLVEERNSLWDLILSCASLDWLLLSKRPENFAKLLPWPGAFAEPFRNVWLGVTAEDQEHADQRIPTLLATAAAMRFVSYEPALGAVDFSAFIYQPTRCRKCGSTSTHYDTNPHNLPALKNADGTDYKCLMGVPQTGEPGAVRCSMCGSLDVDELSPIDWIIAGDESGPRRRPASADWFRSARDQCEAAGVAFHLKQWAGAPTVGVEGERTAGKIHLPVLDGRSWAQFPVPR